MKLGMLGGTFDPVHVGHTALAAAASRSLCLDRVLFVPNALPPHKPDRTLTPYEHRVGMLRIALEGCPDAELCEVESRNAAPNFTIDTIRTLKRMYGEDKEIYLIIGSDEVPGFQDWREPGAIAAEAVVAIAPRAGWDLEALDTLAATLGNDTVEKMKARAFDADLPDVSSSLIRRMIAAGDDPGALLHPGVADYIRSHHLYGVRDRGTA